MAKPDSIKQARMEVSRNAANGGTLEILNGANQVLVAWPLDTPSGTVVGPVWTLGGFPKTAAALVAATGPAPPTSARIRSAVPADVETALTVGLAGSGAAVILSSMTWGVGQQIRCEASPTLTHAA